MVAPSDVRKRILRTIDASRRAASERRTRAAEAERAGAAVLNDVATPAFLAVAAILRSEGYGFRVLTPAGSVRLTSESSPDDFIELTLDVTRDPPAIVGRVSRRWGRRVLVDEAVVREAVEIGGLTEDDAVEAILARLGPFVER